MSQEEKDGRAAEGFMWLIVIVVIILALCDWTK
jgi:hypothetical protein